jgi:rSAM/selenodomain-associated transferase 2
MISVVIPTLNEAGQIGALLQALQAWRARGAELIVIDSGSADDTARLAEPWADIVLTARRGRAAQMNAGAARARGEILLFLHADTRLPDDADTAIVRELARGGRVWGRFDVDIDGRSPLLRCVAWAMNLRSRWTGVATGDQAMFVRRAIFQACGGFPDIALMEDIALSKRLKAFGPPVALRARALTSGRRWQTRGVLRTVLLMWRLRLAYFLGADPERLARLYGDARS